jgi:hypothetical protein
VYIPCYLIQSCFDSYIDSAWAEVPSTAVYIFEIEVQPRSASLLLKHGTKPDVSSLGHGAYNIICLRAKKRKLDKRVHAFCLDMEGSKRGIVSMI